MMDREEARLSTFKNWPVPFLDPQTMARNGFYYLGRRDEVRCAFCKVEIMRWVEGDDPEKDHRKWAPQCPFLRSLTVGGRDEVGSGAVHTPGPANPRYALEQVRLLTFKDWPKSIKQKPKQLAEAGLYYTGRGDMTKCFYCDGGLKDWEENDIPWEQHARWFDKCAYVKLVKGEEYVQKVITEACAVSTEQAPQPENVESPKKFTTLEECKICFENNRNVCFVPCGHVVACAKCALTTNTCPMCRQKYINAVRVYYS
ncbi:Iap-3 [Epinotia aporema granulovirus]|uniref:Iap-3 n=1 Tax=Epinotia aporema granulovirus TaxID=166056 RepID=K4EQ13_9BBAC|nr:Iap-3 [Epinotia aporema granulovirus]AER41437.1 Iap-3 [Epinotia aporema granulovirus]